MAKYWRLKIQPFGDLKGVFISLHTTKSDISLFYRGEDGQPCHRFKDNVPAATALALGAFRQYAGRDDILLPPQGSQKPGSIIYCSNETLLEEGRACTTWNAWNRWIKKFQPWVHQGDFRKPNPRKQYACEVDLATKRIIDLKERAW